MRGDAVDVACDGVVHRMALAGDDVVLLDHDEGAERVLEALGGETGGCLGLAAAWRHAPWHDAVPCLLLDDAGAAAMAAGKSAAAAGLHKRTALIATSGGRGSSAAPVDRGVERLATSAALLGLPGAFRRACGHRALAERVAAWRTGVPMSAQDRELLEHELEPLLGRRLDAEGRHLPPGGRPVRAHIVGPGSPPALVPGRRVWDAHIPIGAVAWLITTTVPLSQWFNGR